MNSIPNEFEDTELLLRAVWPPDQRPRLWTGRRISSAVFKDSRGVSVDRTYHRPKEEAVESMKKRFCGAIVSISVTACRFIQAYPVYCPHPLNKYHSEIHGSESEIELSDTQALYLSREAVMEYDSNISFVS